MTTRPSVLCRPSGRAIHPEPDETLLAAALRSEVPLASSCGGKAVCGDCLVRVVAGEENLTPPDADELAFRKRTGRGGGPMRLACCVRVTGPVEVATTYW